MDTATEAHPKIVVITPVRNEAWVLEAFLTCTSSWADHIIIADQCSTDGSREIALRFPKVTLLTNPFSEWVEFECRRQLLEAATKIAGDKIIFALDADEFLSVGFDCTDGWRKMMESRPNEIFYFRWLNLYDDFNTVATGTGCAEWVAHFAADVDIVEEYRKRERHAVHCQRVPCLEVERCRYTEIDDIRFVHLAKLNHRRTCNKLDFYQVVNIDKNPDKSNPVAMYRSYNEYDPATLLHLDSPVPLYCLNSELDCRDMVKESDYGQHFVDEMVAIFQREGCKKFNALCIWDNADLQAAGIQYRPPLLYRIIHSYLRLTQKYCHSFPIRAFDGLLKLFL